MGEVTSRASVDYEKVAREQIRRIGYVIPGIGFDADTCEIMIDVHEQSPDIAMGVNRATEEENGAGDQDMMFGYACTETENYMPLAIDLSHKMLKRVAAARKNGEIKGLLPDSKGQIAVVKPVSIHVETFGTGKKTEEEIIRQIENREDLTPTGIIRKLDLKRPTIVVPLAS